MEKRFSELWKTMGRRYQSHPWHGINIGADAPEILMSFIEMTPSDTVKYEIDKDSGFIKVDRPQKFSNIVPALYGFVPQTYCDKHVAQLCMDKSGKTGIKGDKDPLDILVLTERNITHGNIIVPAIPIGGFRMIDDGEADDKIIAVLKDDQMYSKYHDIFDCPDSIVNRLRHYFLTYKNIPGEESSNVEIDALYGKEDALEVIRKSQLDYTENYGNIEEEMSQSIVNLFQAAQ